VNLQEPVEAPDELFVRQPPDVVLEWIRNPAISHPDPRFSDVLDPLLAESGLHQLVEILVMRKEDVTANVPGEPLRIDKG
jgi:hypothetical protein